MTTINLSEDAGNAVLDTLARMMDGGSIEVLAGDRVLAVLELSIPAAPPAEGGVLEFNDIAEEDAALAQGTATNAIVIGANGAPVFLCDVGDENSDAVIKLKGTTKIYRGQPVRLTSFRLSMP